ncbi:MAG TPA: hypothetical protein VFS17_00870 [Methylophilaceae bacterium]|nr:hypothetical protein [Methylophilaceae bacterium]
MKLSLLLGLAILLTACSPSSDPDPKIAGSQREVLQKAKGVEDVLQKSADQTSQQADEQTQ